MHYDSALIMETQHPGNSVPISLFKPGCNNPMCNASFNTSSILPLALSTIRVPSHSMLCWFCHACSAIADFSSSPLEHASLCSAILVSILAHNYMARYSQHGVYNFCGCIILLKWVWLGGGNSRLASLAHSFLSSPPR